MTTAVYGDVGPVKYDDQCLGQYQYLDLSKKISHNNAPAGHCQSWSNLNLGRCISPFSWLKSSIYLQKYWSFSSMSIGKNIDFDHSSSLGGKGFMTLTIWWILSGHTAEDWTECSQGTKKAPMTELQNYYPPTQREKFKQSIKFICNKQGVIRCDDDCYEC